MPLQATSMTGRRHCLALGAAAAGALLLPAARAQSYPAKPIRIVVPYPPGGATDFMARVIGEKLATRVGQTVIVDNKAGAGGIVGTDAVAKAAPDGYTVLVSLSTSMLTNQFLYEKLPYNPQRDLALVSHLAVSPVTLVVHPSVPAGTGPELMKYIAANKSKLSYGSWGNGSYAHMAGAHMSQSQNADMSHVPYKGEAAMIQDLLGGQIQLAYASALNAKPHIDAGKLKLIGVTGAKRMAILPNAPTLMEQGLKDEVYQIVGFVGMAVPAKTPKDIVDRLAREVQGIFEAPELVERIAGMGFTVSAGTPEAFAAVYKRDLPVWERLVKQSGAKLE
ncbi:Bug family tripartite tricarboxylate transporter substrate binding protein [Aquabacterium sp.]|uniref:Bug family tripartite tricarboxylate transporter substrate binding protein n=1 Tax=Aquabacterium sp. TaxID=1872578 RepID=UPI002BE5F6E3|nr:tripartite tricarboxylate transporter substrate binding protein [Aquabacterium sp.]HSW04031.1 tripartite tricarboxylate transporter substrate binding protein [Aquabacterium sp.]